MTTFMFLARHPVVTALGIAGLVIASALAICLTELAGIEVVEP